MPKCKTTAYYWACSSSWPLSQGLNRQVRRGSLLSRAGQLFQVANISSQTMEKTGIMLETRSAPLNTKKTSNSSLSWRQEAGLWKNASYVWFQTETSEAVKCPWKCADCGKRTCPSDSGKAQSDIWVPELVLLQVCAADIIINSVFFVSFFSVIAHIQLILAICFIDKHLNALSD